MTSPGVDPLPLLGADFMLRRLSRDDLTAFQAYRRDPALGRYQSWSVLSDEEASAFLGEMGTAPLFVPGHWVQIGIADPVNHHLLGDIGLFVDGQGRCAEIGFTLARHAQGRGVATSAVREAIGLVFTATAVEQVLGITDARNQPSIRLLERVGMRKTEAVNTVFRGEPCVEFIHVVTRPPSM